MATMPEVATNAAMAWMNAYEAPLLFATPICTYSVRVASLAKPTKNEASESFVTRRRHSSCSWGSCEGSWTHRGGALGRPAGRPSSRWRAASPR